MHYELLRLGKHVELEAEISKKLYISDGVDEAVISEFETTVFAYRELGTNAIAERLADKYGGKIPKAVGFIALVDDNPVAMVFGGPKNYESPEGIADGVNVSVWVGAQSRGLGIGTDLMRTAVTITSQTWNDKKIWTSIDRTNVPSQKMCQKVGFTMSHAQLEIGKEGRDIYVA